MEIKFLLLLIIKSEKFAKTKVGDPPALRIYNIKDIIY